MNFVKGIFIQSGLHKHRVYCKENPDHKSGYKEKRVWKCGYCDSIFEHNKEKKLHELRCPENPNISSESNMDNFDKLRALKKCFHEIYNLLTPEQIKEFLDDDKDE